MSRLKAPIAPVSFGRNVRLQPPGDEYTPRPFPHLIHRRNKVSSGPKHFSCEVALPSAKLPRNRNGALTFDVTNHMGNRMLWRNTQTHVNMVFHQVPFDYL